jgi:hypothetical protein
MWRRKNYCFLICTNQTRLNKKNPLLYPAMPDKMPEFTVHFASVYITKCKTGHTNIDFQFGNAYPCSKLVIGF